jgi:aldehyde dehydrogenase (NAD+)
MPLPTTPDPTVAHGGDGAAASLRALFERQGAARARMAATTARERISRLHRLRDALLDHRAALETAVAADFGKSAAELEVTELQLLLGEIRHAAHALPGWMRERRAGTSPLLLGTRSRVRFEPRGRKLVLSPFNYPLLLTFSPLVAALSAGNTAILRPSERVPATGEAMRAVVRDAFAEEEVAMVLGGVEASRALLALPFDHFFFTGSTEVGRVVMRAAAEHLATVTLELGGKSPAIVHRSADLAVAAERIVWGRFVNAGQTCVAPEYVLVHRDDEEAFLEAARRAMARLYGATPDAVRRSPDLARMVDDEAFERVHGALREALGAGARRVAGGEADAAERFIAPTLLASVPAGSRLMREEIFGPVLPVVGVDSLEEAIGYVNARPRPLALYVFSRDPAAAERVIRATRAGGTVVNHAICHLANPHLPFGGVGESGQGSYHGMAGFRAFSHERSVLYAGRFSLAPFYYPPYGARMRRIASLVTRWLASG